jgi:hemerythrin-like domain-containing protein
LTQVNSPGRGAAYLSGMNKCIETMMGEHELIVQVLASLRAMAQTLGAGAPVAREDVADFGRFFREFADQCHHAKEEDRLFVKMVEAGFPRQHGPIAVMLAEHDAGRQEVRALTGVGAGSGPLTPEETATVIEAAEQFVPLLYGHIQKENNILYPMAQDGIAPEELAALDKSCAAFDHAILGEAEIAKLKRLAANLTRKYPADPAELAASSCCAGGCSARA